MTVLTPFEVAKVNVSTVPPVELGVLNKAVILSTGGTSTTAGTITEVTDANPGILSDGTPITSSVHTRVAFSTQTFTPKTITALTSESAALASSSGITWSNGVATFNTAAAHGLPATSDLWVTFEGCVPTSWNGTRRITTTDTDSGTFLSSTDFGALTTVGKISWAEATVTHLLPYLSPSNNNVYYIDVNCNAAAFKKTNTPAFAVDADTLLYPCAETASTFVNGQIKYVKGITAAAHGLPVDDVSFVGVSNTAPLGYNAFQYATATSTTELYLSARGLTSNISTKGYVQAYVVTTASAHTQPIGVSEDVVIDGTSMASQNRSTQYMAATNTKLTAPGSQPVSLGTATGGKLLDADAFALKSKLEAFFKQGFDIPVWVLELGDDTVTNNIATFASWLAANKNQYLNHLVPVGWAANSNFVALAGGYCGDMDLTMFAVPLSDATEKQSFYNTQTGVGFKSVVCFREDDDAQSFEFNPARALYDWSSIFPSAATPIRQQNYRFLKASATEVTPYAGSDRDTLDRLGIAYVDVNAKGLAYPYKWAGMYTGDSIVSGNITSNLIDYSQWWSVYYAALTIQSALDKRVIDSANDPNQRLNLDDTGGVNCINALVATVQNVIDTQLVPFGAINAATVQFVPYAQWKAANPTSYINKTYDGLYLEITPRRGFKKVIINLTANFNG